LITNLSAPFTVNLPDYVAGIDALGFVLGTAVALQFNKGFIPIRKQGKLPVAADAVEFVDYTGRQKGLELRRGALKAGRRCRQPSP
jgi:adenine phosphoribosyltransferase